MSIEVTPVATLEAPSIGVSRTRRTSDLTSSASIGDQFKDRGFGYIPFFLPSTLIPKIMEGWNRFLAEDFDFRMKWRVGDPFDWDDGYVPRLKSVKDIGGRSKAYDGGDFDDKHFFHYRPHLKNLLREARVNTTRYDLWLAYMDVLWSICYRAYVSAAKSLDQALPGFDFLGHMTSKVADTKHVVRLLSYNKQLVTGNKLAKFHVDRNFGTIQVFESHPSLELVLPEGNVLYTPLPDQALAFLSGKAQILTGGHTPDNGKTYYGGILRGIPHGIVVPSGVVARRAGEVRQSIVAFFHIFPEKLEDK